MDGAISSESVLLDAGPESVGDRKVALLLEAGAAGSDRTLQPMRRSSDFILSSGRSPSSSDCDELFSSPPSSELSCVNGGGSSEAVSLSEGIELSSLEGEASRAFLHGIAVLLLGTAIAAE